MWAIQQVTIITTVDEAPSFDHLDGTTSPKGLVRSIFNHLLDASGADTRLTHRAVPYNYQRLLNRIDSRVSPYSSREYLSAIHNPSYRDVKNKMVVKHPSEWYHKKETSIWQSFLNTLTSDAPEWREYCEDYLDKMVWMQDASKLKLGSSLWHMHPVMFLGVIKGIPEHEITVELIEKLLGHTNPWFTGKRGGKAFATHFKKTYPDFHQFDKQTFVNLLNEQLAEYGISTPYHKAHFLSQCLHESAHLDTTIEFGAGRNYDPGQHKDAVKNDNSVVGDGPRYKGGGLMQLTWKKKNTNIFINILELIVLATQN
ncbi:hypothetical protein ACRPH4_06755 [Pantoea allii]|uniref:hypothetical protein n=1 Tax=Pantoea allii TaxID=574096 RepID=UPI003D79CE65